jgi:hypothetical protein
MDPGLQMLIFMGLILKIPVLGAAWLIWHAVKAEPDPAEAAEDEGGSSERRRFRREPKRPRGPRRGPHAPDALPIPCADGEGGLRVLRRRPPAVPLTASTRERH